MRSDFLDRLRANVLVSSGGLGTNLQSKGFVLGQCTPEWCVNHPEAYQGIIKTYFGIGCDVGSTSASGANRYRLKHFGLEDKTEEYNIKLARLAREVTPKGCYLAATMGTTGQLLQPLGDATPDEIYEVYAEQAKILAKEEVDFFWALTMTDIDETCILIKAVKDNTDLPLIVSMSFDRTSKGYRTMMGVDPVTAAKKIEGAGADGVGTNCGGTSFQDATEILRQMRENCNLPLVAKPNAGIPELREGKSVHPATPEEMAIEAPQWVSAGARMLGGCCGTTPEYIAKLIAAIRR